MALQELATNAAKYGALSSSAGRVQIRWTVERGLDALSAGPSAAARRSRRRCAAASDRGSSSATLAQDLNGEVAVSFEREGVVCAVAAPLQ